MATIADELVRARVSADTKTAVLAALIDHIGLPSLADAGRLADRYRYDPAIRDLFARRAPSASEPERHHPS